MNLISTGQVNREEKEAEYLELRNSLKPYFKAYDLSDPNNFSSLLEFYGYYRSKMGTYDERRNFVKIMYENVEKYIEDNLNKKTTEYLDNTSTSTGQPLVVAAKENAPQNMQKILVIYGRNDQARLNLFNFLRAIGLHPMEWSELINATRQGSPYIGEVLAKGFSEVTAVIALMTPDDEGKLRDCFVKAGDLSSDAQLTSQARLNVIFEVGMAFGYCADKTIIVELGSLRPFSDIIGRHVVRLDNSPEKRNILAQRLKTIGCYVNLTGTDWLKIGEFKV